jgi:hypothetical protein
MELEKALHEDSSGIPKVPDLNRVKARTEVIADFEDLEFIRQMLAVTPQVLECTYFNGRSVSTRAYGHQLQVQETRLQAERN